MSDHEFGAWLPLDDAPRDGTRIIVAIRESEQGPGEVDVVRWARAPHTAEKGWIAADSDPECVIAYTDGELACWMPLPQSLPPARAALAGAGLPRVTPDMEIGGSGI